MFKRVLIWSVILAVSLSSCPSEETDEGASFIDQLWAKIKAGLWGCRSQPARPNSRRFLLDDNEKVQLRAAETPHDVVSFTFRSKKKKKIESENFDIV